MEVLYTLRIKELERLDVLNQWQRGQINGKRAAQKLRISTWQFRNIRRAYERSGVKGFNFQGIREPSNRRMSTSVRVKINKIIKPKRAQYTLSIPTNVD